MIARAEMSDEPGASGTAGAGGPRDIIVIGASAGGVGALQTLVGSLPRELPAAIFVVLHIPATVPSILPQVLQRAGRLPAEHPRDGQEIRPGHIYVAPPDRHLLLSQDGIRLSAGPRENHCRPAIDPLFRSAAVELGPRVIGVVLSGTRGDGAAGLWEVKDRGGVAVVQSPDEAPYPDMPHAAINQVAVDHVVRMEEMPRLLVSLVLGRQGDGSTPPGGSGREGGPEMSGEERKAAVEEKPGSVIVDRDTAAQVSGNRDNHLTVYVCPECGGAIWQSNAGPILRFRCHVGHVYSGDDLLEGYTMEMERTLWYALRTLRDKANLTRQLANNAHERGSTRTGAAFEEKARLDDAHANVIERMLNEAVIVNRDLDTGDGP